MKKRIETFEKSLPIFDVFEKAGTLKKIHAEGTIGEIFGKMETIFEEGGLITKKKP
jgi:adenylate kinase family enzyme